MDFLKKMFPAGPKVVGTILMAAAGVMIWSVLNSKFQIDSKVEKVIPDFGSNMKKAA